MNEPETHMAISPRTAPSQIAQIEAVSGVSKRSWKRWLFMTAVICLAGEPASAGFVYNFRFTTSAELGNTGVDGEVTGYFSLPDVTLGIIDDLFDAVLINELVVTSDTTGTGFAPIGVNLLTYSDPVLGITGWELNTYNEFVANGTTATGQLAFAASSGGGNGGLRPSLVIGQFSPDQRVGIITWNPDLDRYLGNRKVAAGSLEHGDTIEISAANAVPEPGSVTLLGLGLIGLARFAGRRRHAA
jgi:hypothetical protein